LGIDRITFDLSARLVTWSEEGIGRTAPFSDPEAFEVVSLAWLQVGWDTKYVYSFTWLGRPIIQLPDDLIRIQEALYLVRPTVVIETGVAHGGSLVFYASVLRGMGLDDGRVIGIDIDIRSHNRVALEQHELGPMITLIEADSLSERAISAVSQLLRPEDRVLVVLDSNHTRSHVLAELRAYSQFVAVGSYIVACDGIMRDLVGAPRSEDDWATNNPSEAVAEFLASERDFQLQGPPSLFNEGEAAVGPTYWPDAWVRRIR
jgi:cephalosporin hydroxylase